MKHVETVAELMIALGGRSAVARKLGLTRASISKWCSEGVMPGYLYLKIMPEMASAAGIVVPDRLYRLERKPGTGLYPRQQRVAQQARRA